jgi:hypothetical protein
MALFAGGLSYCKASSMSCKSKHRWFLCQSHTARPLFHQPRFTNAGANFINLSEGQSLLGDKYGTILLSKSK